MSVTKQGVNCERHREIASMLVVMDEVLAPLCVEIGNSYRLASKQVNDIHDARKAISKARSSLEDAMFGQYPELPDSDTAVYYPRRPRTSRLISGLNEMRKMLDMSEDNCTNQ